MCVPEEGLSADDLIAVVEVRFGKIVLGRVVASRSAECLWTCTPAQYILAARSNVDDTVLWQSVQVLEKAMFIDRGRSNRCTVQKA